MRETDLYSGLTDAAKREGFHLHRVQDAAGKAPFDMVGLLPGGRLVAVEVKVERRISGLVTSGPMPASWWTGRRHQLGWLCEYASWGAVSLVMVVDAATGKWLMIRVPAGLTGDIRMMAIDTFEVVRLGKDLTGWREAFTEE